jgi:ATP-dependent DNA helicase RecQ
MTTPSASSAAVLPGAGEVLQSVFGFRAFRANQQAVCEAAIAGRDLLLVMPTGSGKSLCYQLPALVRGGTALVVSPLIALMEDQSAKLSALGLRVARIHSGMDRAASREACRDYLDGRLQFFFLAPERLRVPGFTEMLARRKPSLIAIDEAHCISQWGHDFRPDYRLLRQHIAALRPAPVIALTATATPIVQNDIVEQLEMKSAARFIHGFRRDNLAIEAVEVSKPRRTRLSVELLAHAERRPAIIYAPTRKEAEATAAELAALYPSAAYHAGMEPQARERIQREFLSGTIEVVVATIAFGMGIDKADVRTVIHTALPGSVEGYYQEIGRAGRDGLPSRTILMHSFADRRTHEFFYQRDYPELAILDRIVRKLGANARSADDLRFELDMDAEVFARALEKLEAHGGVAIDAEGQVSAAGRAWRDPYARQCQLRQTQLEKVLRFAEGGGCRMSALVAHFGDEQDAGACGLCDFCAPEDAVAQVFRPLTRAEEETTFAVVRALRAVGGISTGKLHKQLFPSEQTSRDDFEALLLATARGGYAALEDAAFEKDGRTVAYRRVSLTEAGEELTRASRLRLFLPDAEDPGRRRATGRAPDTVNKHPSGADHGDTRQKKTRPVVEVAYSPAEAELERKLRAWRSEEAKKNSFPAYCVFADRTLQAIVLARPRTLNDLLQLDGMGPAKAARFGEDICRICASE